MHFKTGIVAQDCDFLNELFGLVWLQESRWLQDLLLEWICKVKYHKLDQERHLIQQVVTEFALCLHKKSIFRAVAFCGISTG